MLLNNFKLEAIPVLQNIHCEQCGNDLIEVTVSNHPTYFYCGICKLIYKIELVKISKNKQDKNIMKEAHQYYLNSEKNEKKRSIKEIRDPKRLKITEEKRRIAFNKIKKMIEELF